MIEALVGYIEKQGYAVSVLPGRLFLQKPGYERAFGVWWAISQIELKYAYFEGLCMEAQRYMSLLEEAITQERAGV